jgi:PBP1b-binding outer membrane lipoprotein LpoB
MIKGLFNWGTLRTMIAILFLTVVLMGCSTAHKTDADHPTTEKTEKTKTHGEADHPE